MGESMQVAQELTISHDGRPFLIHFSRTWEVNSKGEKIRPLAMESGFWRSSGIAQVELVLAHPTGVAETWHGEMDMVQFLNNDIATETLVTARIIMNNGSQFKERESLLHTKTATPFTGGVRTYVMPQPDILGWVYDMETAETPLTSHSSFKLNKVGAHES